jgi:RHS repeat-associated protein
VDYQYDPAGRLLSRVTANGARLTQQFDANGWATQLSQYDAANNLVSQTSYTRDRVGNITSQSDAGGTSSYTLDALYRLTQADLPGAANDELFSYDKVGNRKTYTKRSLSQGGSTRFYNYTANTNRLADIRIGSATGTVESSFAHDFEGRLTSQSGIGAKTLTWDAKGRVKTVGAESYSYDPMDYRIGRSGGSLGNRSYFLEGEHLESEYSGEQLQAKYFRGSGVDELVAAWMYDTDSKLKPFLFHQDQVTSTTAVSGHNGGTTQSVRYAAFGAVQSSTGSSPNRLKYTGREDDGAGLYYYRARYYDPVIGRFVSEDPLGLAAGDVNFYQYTANNPVNANDPSGKVAETIWDAANISLGVGSLVNNVRNRNWGWAAVDSLGLAYDTVATAIPFLPAGASAGISAYRAGNTVVSSAQVGLDVARTASVANDVARSASTTGRATAIGTSIHRQVGDALEQGSVLSSSANNFFRGANRATGPQPDLSWRTSPGVWADLTTPGQWSRHVNHYTNKLGYGEGIPLLYQPGVGLTSTTPLRTFAGAGLTGTQLLTDSLLSGPSAGGFLLYPNKANANMMQSVYAK